MALPSEAGSRRAQRWCSGAATVGATRIEKRSKMASVTGSPRQSTDALSRALPDRSSQKPSATSCSRYGTAVVRPKWLTAIIDTSSFISASRAALLAKVSMSES